MPSMIEMAPVRSSIAKMPAFWPIWLSMIESEKPSPVMFMTPITTPAPPAIMSRGNMFSPPPTTIPAISFSPGMRRRRIATSTNSVTTAASADKAGSKPRPNSRYSSTISGSRNAQPVLNSARALGRSRLSMPCSA